MFEHIRGKTDKDISNLKAIIEPIQNHIKIQNTYFNRLNETLENINLNMAQIKDSQIQALNFFTKLTKINKNQEKIEKQTLNQIKQSKVIKKEEQSATQLNDTSSQNSLQKMTNILIRMEQIQKLQLEQFVTIAKKFDVKKQKENRNENDSTQNSMIIVQSKNHRPSRSMIKQIASTSTQSTQQHEEQTSDNIDYKDRFIIIPLELIKYDKQNEIQQLNMHTWVSELYERLSQEAFFGYFNKKINEQETKVFFSQNLILNTVKMMQYMKNKDRKSSINLILDIFEQLSDSALEYQLKKYPQKKKILLKPQVENLVEKCETAEDPQYDILRNMKFIYQYNQTGVYYTEIKQMINKFISMTAYYFQQYKDNMKAIFTINKLNNQTIDNRIGRKINENTPPFQQTEIGSNRIQVKSPQILRIMIKWIQQLEKKISDLQSNIQNRYFPFPSKDYSEIRYSKQTRQTIRKRFQNFLSTKSQYKFKSNLVMLENIELEMLNYIQNNSKNFTYISENNTEVGLATHLLAEAVSEIASKHLNAMLHTILSFQKQQSHILNKQQSFQNACYITFSVYDLLRSKCSGTYQKIRIVYENLLKNPNFKIIKVKNRLQTGNRDFLINMRFKDSPMICQLQLGLVMEKSNQNEKQDCLDHFNHFLYELRRSKYGPLTEAAILNAHNCQSISYFQEKFKKIRYEKEDLMKLTNIGIKPKVIKNQIQIEGHSIEQLKIIYVCHNCLQLKSSQNSFLKTFKRLQQNEMKYVCGQCALNSLQQNERTKYLLGDNLSEFFQQIKLDKMKRSHSNFYLILLNNNKRKIYRRLDDYYIQNFTHVTQENFYKFESFHQLNIKYAFRLHQAIDIPQKYIKISTIEQLNKRTYINQHRKDVLTKFKDNWKQAICITGLKGNFLIIDASRQSQGNDLQRNLNQFKRTKEIKNLKESKVQLMDLQFWDVGQQFFQTHLKSISDIKKLNLSENHLNNFDNILKGKNIRQLKLNKNLIQKIKIENKSLEKLEVNHNKLISIDLSALTNLKQLDLSGNQLQFVDLSVLSHLEIVNLSINHFKNLQLNNVNIKMLILNKNQLESIDLSKQQNLYELQIGSNRLKSLKLNNPKLMKLDAQANQLEEIDINKAIMITQLNISKNRFTNITLINKFCKKLNLSYNFLTDLDISKMIHLKDLKLYSNPLKSLTLTNEQLIKLDISKNQNLSKLDINKLINLDQLRMFETNFSELIIDNPKLRIIDASTNQLKNVNFKKAINLRQLNLSSNQLTTLELDNINLEILQVANNQLQVLDIKKLLNIKILNIIRNKIANFTVDNSSLQQVVIGNNKLKSINLQKLFNLKYLNVSSNELEQFYASNPDLQKILANNNKIKKINITKLNKIRQINFNKNRIEEIVLENESLEKITLDYNRLTQLDLTKLKKLNDINLSNNCLVDLKISKINANLQKITLGNSKNVYLKYMVDKLLTSDEKERFKIEKQKSGTDESALIILNLNPNSPNFVSKLNNTLRNLELKAIVEDISNK